MATQVQFRGGSSTEHNSFTGAAREVTVDTTKDTVVVHDGSTAGGHPLQKQYPALGSVSAPTYTFVGDTNTGIYSPGADQVAISTNGTGRLFVDASGNVGVGYSTPGNFAGGDLGASRSLVVGDGTATTNVNIFSDSTGYGHLAFGDGTSGTSTYAGLIQYYHTSDSMALYTAASERMRIDSSGNVGIGTTSPGSRLHVRTPNSTASTTEVSTIVRDNSGYFLKLSREASSGNTGGLIGADSVGTYYTGGHNTQNMLYIQAAYGVMSFYTNNAERARIDSSGNLLIGGTLPSAPAISLNADGTYVGKKSVTVDRTATSNPTFRGQLNGADTFKVLASGSAVFAGKVGVGSTSTPPDDFSVTSTASRTTLSLNADSGQDTRLSFKRSGTYRFNFINDSTDNFSIQNSSFNSIISFNTAGTVGIGGTLPSSPNITLNANGSASFAGTVTANGTVLTSDQRFKENITPANPQLADIKALGAQLKNYDWNADAPSSNGNRQLGLIAQDVEAVCPGIVKTIARTKQGAELTPEVVVPAVYETRTVPAVLDDEGEVVKAETTEQVLVTEEQITPATYEELDDSYKGISHDALIMKLLGAVAELSAKVAALEGA